jgi:uncharacterized protein (DUF433 family)
MHVVPRNWQRAVPDCIVMTTTVLEREMFSEAEASRLLRVPQSTLHWWLDGGTYRNRRYRPVIRMEPTSGRSVTWAEFVEAGLLREYRRTHGVALSELRTVIDRLREAYGTPYPLAHHRPFVGPGRELLLEVQQEARLDAELCLVAVANDQLVLTPAVEAFVQRVEWAEDIPVSWRPHNDPLSPVRMAPDVRFGNPAIKGVSTEVLWEHVEEAGEDLDEVADAFGLDVDDVRWALAYETSARAA